MLPFGRATTSLDRTMDASIIQFIAAPGHVKDFLLDLQCLERVLRDSGLVILSQIGCPKKLDLEWAVQRISKFSDSQCLQF